MQTRIGEISPLPRDVWVRDESVARQTPLVEPVQKTEKGSSAKIGKDEKTQTDKAKGEKSATGMDSGEAKDLVDEVESYLKDFNVQLDFSIAEKTGDVVVKVINRDTGDVIRQIPPEELIQFREKLKELRGVLFDGKI